MWKCKIDNNSLKFNRPNELNSVQSLPPGQYNTLQHNYTNDRNSASNDEFIITPDGHSPPVVHSLPVHHHNGNSFIHSSDSEMQLGHTTNSLSNHSNNMLQDSGYVLPDDCSKPSHITSTSRSNFPTESEAKKTTNKPTVILKSDGTGFIKTGNLQALIPNNESFELTPSQTHESYFDVKKIDN